MSFLNNNTDPLSHFSNSHQKAELPQGKKKKSAQAASITRERHKQRYLENIRRQKQKEQHFKEKKELSKKDEEATIWRDRAAERRKGGTEYTRVAEEYKMLQNRSVEESKFLGGDVEHTHLVKGLDYVLLAKVRSEIEKQKTTEAELPVEPPSPSITIVSAKQETKGAASNVIARKICQEFVEQIHPHHTSFAKKLERIDSVVLRGAHFRGNTKNFESGRMVYQFDLSWNMGKEDTPVIVFQSIDKLTDRSQTGCSSNQSQGVIAPIHHKILSDLSEILLWHSHHQKTERRKKESTPSYFSDSVAFDSLSDTLNKDDDEEEDIFADVGRYTSADDHISSIQESTTTQTTTTTPAALQTMNQQKYFDYVEGEESKPPPSSLSIIKDTIKTMNDSMINLSKQLEKKSKIQSVGDYNECYPMMDMSTGMMDNSDSDNDDKAKGKRNRKQEFLDLESKKKIKSCFLPFRHKTNRSTKRQADREWKEIESYMEEKKGRSLNNIENESKKKVSNAPTHSEDISHYHNFAKIEVIKKLQAP